MIIMYLIVIVSLFTVIIVILTLYNWNTLQGQSCQDTTQSILPRTDTTSLAELLLLYYHCKFCFYFKKIILLIHNMFS